MEKIHKLKLYNFCALRVVFRKKEKLISWGNVILTEVFEFAGHMNNDTLIGFFKDEEFHVVYHVESFDIQSIPFSQDAYKILPVSYEYKFEMSPIDEEFVGRTYESFDGEYSIEFEEAIDEKEKVEYILNQNKDLFVKP